MAASRSCVCSSILGGAVLDLYPGSKSAPGVTRKGVFIATTHSKSLSKNYAHTNHVHAVNTIVHFPQTSFPLRTKNARAANCSMKVIRLVSVAVVVASLLQTASSDAPSKLTYGPAVVALSEESFDKVVKLERCLNCKDGRLWVVTFHCLTVALASGRLAPPPLTAYRASTLSHSLCYADGRARVCTQRCY